MIKVFLDVKRMSGNVWAIVYSLVLVVKHYKLKPIY